MSTPKNSIEILCTLGPSSMNDRVIRRLEELGVTLFRINLSHTKVKDLPHLIETIRRSSAVPVCLDTEGAQIRTGDMVEREVAVRENRVLYAHPESVPGDAQHINLYPMDIVHRLEPGDFVSIDFNAVLVQVLGRDERGVVAMRVINGGRMGQNKAVTVERDIEMPTLTHKDMEALAVGRRMGIRHVALSFANRASDVEEVRRHVSEGTTVISKIECRNGLVHLEEIARASDALLIDRGDLSRQEPIERIPYLQKRIIRQASKAGRKVYVATNLLESMIASSKPTRAEVNDVINTLIDGASGLVLAAETAIGKDPIGCASMIVKLIHEYQREEGRVDRAAYYPEDAKSLLVDPHGGRLVHREVPMPPDAEIGRLRKLAVDATDLMDAQQIALGTYSPLTGFMDHRTLESVLREDRLPDGNVWTMPILLQVSSDNARALHKGERIALTDPAGVVYALLDVTEVYRLDPAALAGPWFGTASAEHPGVRQFTAKGEWAVAGAVSLVRRIPSPYARYELTCAQSRFVFTHKDWSRVVGFHTRNVVHRAHEHIQLEALRRTGADGLYITPVIGSRREGDFLPEAVIKSYQMMMDFGYYPEGRVVVGCLATYPRFSGPREAAFTALCRKNMGCSHFIIGRNHSGVGDYYKDEDYPKLFDRLGDIGITPVFFEAIGYDPRSQAYDSLAKEGVLELISGTQMREALKQDRPLPDWFMREVIQDALKADIRSKGTVFYES
ncbi:MAG: Sulfate adenylyltransferase [Candidatus Omnitrophica bacterium]|nr:Sulfate adenylyltransferase [Candidatus Omnitrophota bacterium]